MPSRHNSAMLSSPRRPRRWRRAVAYARADREVVDVEFATHPFESLELVGDEAAPELAECDLGSAKMGLESEQAPRLEHSAVKSMRTLRV